MKHLLTLLIAITVLSASGQEFIALGKVGKNDSLPNGQAIMYGEFIQRLGFSSGGFPQDIRIQNVDTKVIYKFRVKPTYKSKKENPFIVHIPSGKYRILVYWWTQSKWYGGKMFTEPIYKGFDSSTKEFSENLKDGKIKIEDLKQYEFTIERNVINYLGTWHFDSGLVSFSNDKDQFDMEIGEKYKLLNFNNANISLPE